MDDVYTRVPDLEGEYRVFAAGILYHNAWMSTYLPTTSKKQKSFQDEVDRMCVSAEFLSNTMSTFHLIQ